MNLNYADDGLLFRGFWTDIARTLLVHLNKSMGWFSFCVCSVLDSYIIPHPLIYT